MLGGCKNEKELRSKLEKWSRLGSDLKLVHTVNSAFFVKDEITRRYPSELCNKPAEHVFNTWDVISCSLINIKKLSKAFRGGDLAPWENVDSPTGMFHELGFVLDVPSQNILGTHSHDVWFPNHIDAKKNGPKWGLVDSILSGKGKDGNSNQWPAKTGHSYNRIQTPEHILSYSDDYYHNEILVIGKSNINVYPGFNPTDKIKVSAIICAQKNFTGHSFFSRKGGAVLEENLRILRTVNPKLKVIKI